MSGVEVLDLFSAAAGGWSLGMHRAGYKTIAACEVEAWRRTLYSENNPHVRMYDDVRTLTADRLLADLGRLPTIVVGSPPCQDISSANTKGRGVEGERSGLYFEAIRIIGEVRPRWFALENSANLRTRGADAVIAALEAIGYTCWPCVVRAGDDPRGAGAGVGANHERERCWLIGCDLEQVTDPNGVGSFGRSGRGIGIDVCVPADPEHAESLGYEGRWAWRHGADGYGSPPVGAGHVGDPTEDGRRSQLSGRCAGPVAGPEQFSCGDAADAARIGCPAWPGDDEGSRREADGYESANGAAPGGPECETAHANRNGEHAPSVNGEMAELRRMVGDRESRDTPNPDQAGQADGCMVSGLRQAEIADDGRGAERSADGQGFGQMGLCPPDRDASIGRRADWSLADLADHLRLDDGLSAWLAGQRVALGDGKGASAASLVVEAFGDAVIPQIPEAIGRAIFRVERALSAVHESLRP